MSYHDKFILSTLLHRRCDFRL